MRGLRAYSTAVASHVRLQPYGVLGTRLTTDGGVIRKAEPPGGSIGFVDPAGLDYIQSGPSGAGGAAGAIYRFLNISEDPSFPDAVSAAITAPGHAKHHRYALADGHVDCVHVVGPDLRTGDYNWERAVRTLATAYEGVLRESAQLHTLRLLPISGGIFSGKFRDQLPLLTHEALTQALGRSAPAAKLDMCIFMQSEWQAFVDAGFVPAAAQSRL